MLPPPNIAGLYWVLWDAATHKSAETLADLLALTQWKRGDINFYLFISGSRRLNINFRFTLYSDPNDKLRPLLGCVEILVFLLVFINEDEILKRSYGFPIVLMRFWLKFLTSLRLFGRLGEAWIGSLSRSD